ncbi:MAG: arylamine N-acetyltransferase [Spirochaetia bacterium]|nr:arylamine N-acetyltransferase [Spirochaetia bacterium]
MENFVQKYLARINYNDSPKPALATLRKLHRQHLLSIPFENLSIMAHQHISLDFDTLSEKILDRGRGGFCFELNGLFFKLLEELGFTARMVSARVLNPDGEFGPEYDHMAIIVSLDEDWLVDVGFGNHFLEPVPILSDQHYADDEGYFKVERHGPDMLALMRSSDGVSYTCDYIFTIRRSNIEDFTAMCEYHQTSPDAPNTQNLFCTMAIPGGRKTLSGSSFFIRNGEGISKILLTDKDGIQTVLQEHFGITVGENQLSLLPQTGEKFPESQQSFPIGQLG